LKSQRLNAIADCPLAVVRNNQFNLLEFGNFLFVKEKFQVAAYRSVNTGEDAVAHERINTQSLVD
jgi:hypothetical protein